MTAAAIGLLFVFPGRCGAGQDAPLLLKVATTKLPESYACQGIEQFKEEVETASSGSIEVQIYPGEQLGSRSDILEGMAIGTIEMAYLSAEPSGNIDKNVLKTGTAVTIRHDLWTSQEVNTLEDLSGLRIWYPDIALWIQAFQDADISASTLSLTQVYDGLQAGLLDGVLLDEETAYRYKLYECCKFCCELENYTGEDTFFISKEVHEQLSEENRRIVEQAARRCTDWIQEQMQEGEEELHKELENSGVKFDGKSSEAGDSLDERI